MRFRLRRTTSAVGGAIVKPVTGRRSRERRKSWCTRRTHPVGVDNPDGTVHEVLTADGVRLSLERRGEGPTVVLVHGGATDRRCFDPILPFLEGYTTVAYDRRGYGESEDGEVSGLETEVGDFAAVVQYAADGGSVRVIGYSFGALVALTALSTRTLPVLSAVLYEPPMAVEGMFPALDELLDLIDRGKHDDALGTFVTSTFHLTDRVVDSMRRWPSWDVSVQLIPKLSRELPIILSASTVEPTVNVPPTRVLVAASGGNPAFRRIAMRVAAALPSADVATVPGVPHFAMSTAPEAFVAAARAHWS